MEIQSQQNEIISLWHKIFKSKKVISSFYVELVIARIKKPPILHKLLKNLKKKYFDQTKRQINKVMNLLILKSFQILPAYLVKRKQKLTEVRTTSNQPNLHFKINNH